MRARRFLTGTLVAVGLLAAGCQDYVFEPVVPAMIAVSNSTYTVSSVDKADILFVIDDSGSMSGEQDNLARNFDAFVRTLEAKNAERESQGLTPIRYRLAVTSTAVDFVFDHDGDPATPPQVDESYGSGGAACESAYDIRAGDPFPQGALLAAPGNQAILDSEQLSSEEIIRQFRANAMLGICGSGKEQGLRAMQLALEGNPDFVRDESKLVVAFLSDEEDCSDPAQTVDFDACEAEAGQPDGGLLESVQHYIDFLRDQAPMVATGVIVSATGTPPDLQPGICRDPVCEAACDSGGDPQGWPCYCGGQGPGGRYLQLARAVGGVQDSICQEDFATTLEDLAEVVVDVECVDLTSRPYDDDPSLILLEIEKADGGRVQCTSPSKGETCESDPAIGWRYTTEAGRPQICLCRQNTASECRIGPGDRYRVSFVQEACSPDAPCRE